MLSGKKLDRKLHGYVKHFSSRGYSESRVKQALINSGLDYQYSESIIKKHREKEFMKKYSAYASLVLFVIIMASIFPYFEFSPSITGLAVHNVPRDGHVLINAEYDGSSLRPNSVSFVDLNGVIGPNANSGFLVRTVSEEKVFTDLFYQEMNQGNNLIFVPNSKDLERIQIIGNENEVLLEININEIT